MVIDNCSRQRLVLAAGSRVSEENSAGRALKGVLRSGLGPGLITAANPWKTPSLNHLTETAKQVFERTPVHLDSRSAIDRRAWRIDDN